MHLLIGIGLFFFLCYAFYISISIGEMGPINDMDHKFSPDVKNLLINCLSIAIKDI